MEDGEGEGGERIKPGTKRLAEGSAFGGGVGGFGGTRADMENKRRDPDLAAAAAIAAGMPFAVERRPGVITDFLPPSRGFRRL